MTKVEVLPIEQGATPDPQNVNKHTQRGRGLHENSMRKRGAGRSIFSAGKGVEIPVVMGGNQTLEIAASLGMEIINVHTNGNQIVNVVRDDIAPNSPEFFALGIEDNEIGKQSYSADIDQLALLAAADNSVLAETRRQDKIFGDMLAGMGVKGEEPVDAEPQIDRAAELAEKWQTSTGQLWKLGDHRLLIGDCTVRENVDRLMGGERAMMCFTDPPYNVSYQDNESIESLKKRNRRTDGLIVSNDSMSDEDFDKFLFTFLSEIPVDAGGAFYLCSPPGNPETQFRNAINRVSGLMLKECIVWVKDQFVFGRQDYHWRHESILYGWKEGAAHYFIDDHTQDTVWEIKRPRVSELHPTMKPIEIPEKGIKNSSTVGAIVYEPFAGSGTTIIAAHNLNRRCFACEISEKYGAVILERFYTATGITPELVE